MKEKGSLTVFVTVIMAGLLLLAGILGEWTYYKRTLSYEYNQLYLELDRDLREFHQELFENFGLLGVAEKKETKGLFPLKDHQVLLTQIQKLMEMNTLYKGVAKGESLVSQFLGQKLHVGGVIFDLNRLNRELHEILSFEFIAEPQLKRIKNFVTNLVSVQGYAHLSGISYSRLKRLLKEGDLETIAKCNPVFTVKPSIEKTFHKTVETLRKYDRLHFLDHYFLGDYCIEYLGYSGTKEERKKTSEYIVSGISSKKLSNIYIDAELFLLRNVLNYSEALINPKIRGKLLKTSFGSATLFAIEAAALCGYESYLDVKRIRKGGTVPLYKGDKGFMALKFGKLYYSHGWKYPDYLKLMIFLVSKETCLRRIAEAIEDELDLDLSRVYTGVSREKSVTFRGKTLPLQRKDFMKGELTYDGK